MMGEDYLPIAEKSLKKLDKIIGNLEEHPEYATQYFEQFDETKGEYERDLFEAVRNSQIELAESRIKDIKRRFRIIKRSLQKYPNFSKRTLKERNLAFIASANFAKRFIQSSLKEKAMILGYKCLLSGLEDRT